MTNKIMFDTLSYAKLLAGNNIDHSDIYAEALAEALNSSLYSQNEIDKMFESTLNNFNNQMQQFKFEIRAEMQQLKEELRVEMRLETAALRQEIRQVQQEMSRSMHYITGILGSLIVIVGALNSVLHYLL